LQSVLSNLFFISSLLHVGMGKTTSIGKIAARLKNEGNQTVLLGACDTFRAAAVEQLREWVNN